MKSVCLTLNSNPDRLATGLFYTTVIIWKLKNALYVIDRHPNLMLLDGMHMEALIRHTIGSIIVVPHAAASF